MYNKYITCIILFDEEKFAKRIPKILSSKKYSYYICKYFK